MKNAGFDLIPEEEKEGYINSIIMQIAERIGIVVMKELPDDSVDEYMKLASSGTKEDMEKVQALLESKIENWQKKFEDALKAFADEFLATAESIKF